MEAPLKKNKCKSKQTYAESFFFYKQAVCLFVCFCSIRISIQNQNIPKGLTILKMIYTEQWIGLFHEL